MVARSLKLTRTTCLYIFAYVLLNMLCFFQYRSLGTVSLLVTVILLGLGFLFPYSQTGVYLYVCLPFFNVMNAQIGGTSLYYVLIGIVILRCLLQGDHIQIAPKLLLLCVLVFATLYNFSATKEYIQWVIRLIPLVVLFGTNMIKMQLKGIIDKYTLSMLFSSLWGWLMLRAGTSIYTVGYVYNTRSITIRDAGLVGDAVVYGIQLIYLIALVLIMAFREQKCRTIRISAIVLMVCFGILTYSKTFLICVFLEAIFAFFYWSSKQKNDRKAFWWRAGVFLLVLFSAIALFDYFMTADTAWAVTFRKRILTADFSTGRLDVWAYYVNWLSSSFMYLFRGVGFSNYFVLRTVQSSLSGGIYAFSRAHNLFLETVVLFGLLETLILLGWLLAWAVRTYRKQRDALLFLPLLMLLATGMTTHGHFEYHFYLNVLLVLSVAEGGNLMLRQDGGPI